MNCGYIFLGIINLESSPVGAVAGLSVTAFFAAFLDVKSGKSESVKERISILKGTLLIKMTIPVLGKQMWLLFVWYLYWVFWAIGVLFQGLVTQVYFSGNTVLANSTWLCDNRRPLSPPYCLPNVLKSIGDYLERGALGITWFLKGPRSLS